MSKNILVSTLGASWEIIPETVGAFLYDSENPEMDFYGKNTAAVKEFRERAKSVLGNGSIDELWLLSTEQGNLQVFLSNINEWIKNYLPAKNLVLRVFKLNAVEDITSIDSVEKFHSLALQVLFYSKIYAGGGKRIVSLACGRKTMSADIQDAAYCFGCDMMMHVVAAESKIRVSLDTKCCLTEDEAGNILPVALNQFPASDLFDDLFTEESKREVVNFMDPLVTGQKSAQELLKKVQEKREAAKHFYSAYFSSQQYSYDTFPILYTLSKEGRKALESFVVGVDPAKKESELKMLTELPKADLHFHLGGSLSVEEMIEVAACVELKVKRLEALLPRFAAAALQGPEKGTSWKSWRHKVAETGAIEILYNQLSDQSSEYLCNILESFVAPAYILQFKDCPERLDEILYGPERNDCDLREEKSFVRISTEKKDAEGKIIPDERNLTPYESLGDLQGTSLLRHRETIQKTMEILFRNARKNNLKYIEIRCSPINYQCSPLRIGDDVICNDLDSTSVVREILLAMDSAKNAEDRVDSSMVFIASRHGKSSDTIEQKIQSAVDLYKELLSDSEIGELFGRYFRGFDLAGDESANSPEKMRNAFKDILRDCLSITIHAGETMPVNNIWEAVYSLNAERVGHALKLKDDTGPLLAKFRDRRIGVELCPSSNYQIVGFEDNYYPGQTIDGESMAHPKFQYPLKKYMEEHIRVCVNTDDPGISRTNISNEILRAARLSRGGLSLWQVFSLLYNSFDLAFLPYTEKLDLLSRMNMCVRDWLDKNISRIEQAT